MNRGLLSIYAQGQQPTDEQLADSVGREYQGGVVDGKLGKSHAGTISQVAGFAGVPGANTIGGVVDGALQGNSYQAAVQGTMGLAKDALGYLAGSSPIGSAISGAVGIATASDPRQYGWQTAGSIVGGMLGGGVGAMAGGYLGQLAYDTIGDWGNVRQDEDALDQLEASGLSSSKAREKLGRIDTNLKDFFGDLDAASSKNSKSKTGLLGHMDYSGADMSKLGHEAIATDRNVRSLGDLASSGFGGRDKDNDRGGIGEAEGSSDARGDHGGGGWI